MRRILATAVLVAGLPLSAMAMSFGDPADATFQEGFEKAQAGDYVDAIDVFKAVVMNEPTNADAWNMLGFSHRKLNEFQKAWNAYERALAIDPEHRGAHEYIGEWYLMQGDVASAKAQLAKLTVLCPEGCIERETLAKSIDTALAKG